MSYVIAAPDMVAAAAAGVAGIGSSLTEANAATGSNFFVNLVFQP